MSARQPQRLVVTVGVRVHAQGPAHLPGGLGGSCVRGEREEADHHRRDRTRRYCPAHKLEAPWLRGAITVTEDPELAPPPVAHTGQPQVPTVFVAARSDGMPGLGRERAALNFATRRLLVRVLVVEHGAQA